MNRPSIKDMVDCIMPQVMANDIIGGEPKPIDMSELIKMVRGTLPAMMAEEIVSVQPMASNLFKDAMDAGMNESDLIEQGYRHVSHLKMLWVKN